MRADETIDDREWREPVAVPATTVNVYVIVGTQAADKSKHELGMFFSVLDADNHLKRMNRRDWSSLDIEPRSLQYDELHPVHQHFFASNSPKK